MESNLRKAALQHAFKNAECIKVLHTHTKYGLRAEVLSEILDSGPTPDLLNQNFHFNKILRMFV